MKKLFLCIFFSGLSLTLLHGATIIDKGKSSYVIVYADKVAHPHLLFHNTSAAGKLQQLLHHSTGVRLNVIPESKFDGRSKAIFIGNTSAAAAKGLIPAKYKIWEHHIRVIDGNIYLYGHDMRNKVRLISTRHNYFQLGSFKAVLTLLEKCAGAVFFGSPDVREAIPRSSRFVVPDNFRFDSVPVIQYTVNGLRTIEYDLANNALSAPWYGTYGGHSHPVAVPARKYFKIHPEYFRLDRGRRNPGNQNQLCLSNPQVQKLLYQNVLEHLDRGYEVVQLAQSDGFSPCQCEACQKMYGFLPKFPPKDRRYNSDPCWGQKLWKLHLGFAERLKKDRPGKKVCIIAYGPTRRPPQFTKVLPDNVMVEFAPYNERVREFWKDHKIPGGSVVYLSNWGFFRPEGLMPKMTWEAVRKQVRGFHRDNIKGIYRCGFGELHGVEGPTYYVWGKLLADPDADVDALVKKYCSVAYPGAGEEMVKFFRLLDERLRLVYIKKEIDWNDPELLNGKKGLPGRSNIETIILRYPDKILAELDGLLKAAETKLAPAKSWQMRLVRLEFDYLTLTARAVNALERFKKTPSAENWKKTTQCILAREKFCSSLPWTKFGYAVWDRLPLFGYVKASQLRVGGRMSAPLHAPFHWNIKWYDARNVQPSGRGMKAGDPVPQYLVPARSYADVSDDSVYTRKAMKVSAKADNRNLYLFFIIEGSTYDEAKNYELEIRVGPEHKPGLMKQFILLFRTGRCSLYELIQTNTQRNGKGDLYRRLHRSGGQMTVPAPGIKLKQGEVSGMMTIPWEGFSRTPRPGEAWFLNIVSNGVRIRGPLMIWEHNFFQAGSENIRDRYGKLFF